MGPALPGAVINLTHLAEENTDGVIILDHAGIYLFINREAQRILNIPRAKLLGRSIWDRFPQREEQVFRQHFLQAVQGRVTSVYETYFPALSRWLEIRMVPCTGHRNISSDEHGVTIYFRNVSERVIAETLRTESDTRFLRMANSAPVLIWTSGTDALPNWFNEPWLRFTGHTMGQEVGNGWIENIHPDDIENCQKTYRDAFDARIPFTREYRLKRNDEQYRWLLDNGVPRLSEDGVFQGYIGSCADVTEQRGVFERQRRFVRDMLASVTEGRLCLCEESNDLPANLSLASRDVELNPTTIRKLRKAVTGIAEELQFADDRMQDLLTAVGEAGMNAVTHGGGGIGRVCVDKEKRVIQVWVEDHGKGIREEDLHRATLEKGWSGGESLGHGFFLMLRTCDRTYLLTGERGTTVVLEQERSAPQPPWLQIITAE